MAGPADNKFFLNSVITVFFAVSLAGWIAGCRSRSSPPLDVRTAAWVWTAAEYDACALQAYRTALKQMEKAMKDTSWTASLEQEQLAKNGVSYENFPPAVILDVDETVLSNAEYYARMARGLHDDTRETRDQWTRECLAKPIRGALKFVNAAHERGVRVFYITNRRQELEPFTRRNLSRHGFPIETDMDGVLCKHERPGWGSDKSSRRKFVARSHRILLILGDNLNDFIPALTSRDRRDQLLKMHAAKLGTRWIILPNPLYGSWLGTLLDFDPNLPPEKASSRLMDALTPHPHEKP